MWIHCAIILTNYLFIPLRLCVLSVATSSYPISSCIWVFSSVMTESFLTILISHLMEIPWSDWLGFLFIVSVLLLLLLLLSCDEFIPNPVGKQSNLSVSSCLATECWLWNSWLTISFPLCVISLSKLSSNCNESKLLSDKNATSLLVWFIGLIVSFDGPTLYCCECILPHEELYDIWEVFPRVSEWCRSCLVWCLSNVLCVFYTCWAGYRLGERDGVSRMIPLSLKSTIVCVSILWISVSVIISICSVNTQQFCLKHRVLQRITYVTICHVITYTCVILLFIVYWEQENELVNSAV